MRGLHIVRLSSGEGWHLITNKSLKNRPFTGYKGNTTNNEHDKLQSVFTQGLEELGGLFFCFSSAS